MRCAFLYTTLQLKLLEFISSMLLNILCLDSHPSGHRQRFLFRKLRRHRCSQSVSVVANRFSGLFFVFENKI